MTTVQEDTRSHDAPADRPTELTVLGACAQDCPDSCSMVVTVEDGVATSVSGSKTNPYTNGGLCVKVDNYLDKVYSPDRVLYPLKRSGPKGSGEFERISWDEAVATIAEKFTSIAEEFGPEAIMPCNYLQPRESRRVSTSGMHSSTDSGRRLPSAPTAMRARARPTR
ncbi:MULTISPECIES: molybdopterin-dependent oxidoreductase [Nocardiaceae]|uniref:molybdopterin-dependent oxidoreductase n=1 Tax=Nocardiaceae TaxID=85025 RepID=UPI0024B6D763|nr:MULTISPECIES: molybdopterin-dependent oxidoreductase [Rhodococcus]MDJ0003664.1 molybdopterin-dependent oxidoreductase [Rhodococcus fascians]